MKSIGMMLMAAMVAFGFVACGSDDDNTPAPPAGPGGTSSITVGGTAFGVSYAYWDARVLNEHHTFYTLQFLNTQTIGAADPMDVVSITYQVNDGSQAAPATGEFTDFQVSVTKLSSNPALDRMFIASSTLNGNNAKLKVTGSGAGYQVEFGAMKYTDGVNTTTYDGTAFSFTGGFTKGLLWQ